MSGDLRLSLSSGEVWSGSRQLSLTREELGVLALLMTSGDQGVTTEAIILAAGSDRVRPDAILAQLRRKTGIRGRSRPIRKEHVLLYFFGDEGDG